MVSWDALGTQRDWGVGRKQEILRQSRELQEQVEGAQGRFLFSSAFITQRSKTKPFFLGTAAITASVLFPIIFSLMNTFRLCARNKNQPSVEVKTTSAFPALFCTYQCNDHAQETSTLETTSAAEAPGSVESEHPAVTCHYGHLSSHCCREPQYPLCFPVQAAFLREGPRPQPSLPKHGSEQGKGTGLAGLWQER